jgi:preprotein translocase subunit SecD
MPAFTIAYPATLPYTPFHSMKRLFPLAFAVLLLSACGETPTISFQADVTGVAGQVQRQTVLSQSLNVLERRLAAMGEAPLEKLIEPSGSGAIVTVGAEHQEALDALSDSVQQPFDLRVMAQVADGEPAEVTVENQGGFISTGITGDDLDWVEAGKEPDSDLGAVRLVFSEEGRTKMADLFKSMKGKNIGIFVRGQLISLLQVETDVLEDDIVIRQIPNLELAQVFAEDVNVGIHVTFTPVP